MKTRPATKEECQLAFLWLAAAVSAVALRPVWLALAPFLRPCVFRSLTEIPCPTCGTTRAAEAFLDGNFVTAFSANPFAAAAGLLFVVGAPLAVIWALARFPVPVLSKPIPVWLRFGVIVVVLANWIYVVTTG